MVQLSPFLPLDVAPPPDSSAEGCGRPLAVAADDDSDDAISEKETLAIGLETPAAYQGYETYIEDGLICLKHKVRNLEKKKVRLKKKSPNVGVMPRPGPLLSCRLQLKLEDYKRRLSKGEVLNKDQMVRRGCKAPLWG